MPAFRLFVALPLLTLAPVSQISAQTAPVANGIGAAIPSFGTVAALVVKSDLVIDATIRSATRIRGAEAANVAPDRARFYVEADVTALIRGPGAMPTRLAYVVDAPLDARGHPPKLRKQRVLLFARALANGGNQIQLTDLDGQRPWSAEFETLTRRIVREAVSRGAPPAITGIGNTFHVPGTLPGEGETQIFLTTSTAIPVSLLILRRPGEERRWSVSLGEIVDVAAQAPQRDTLLWYRLACGLPRALPQTSLAAETPENAAIAREDYQFMRSALGPCPA